MCQVEKAQSAWALEVEEPAHSLVQVKLPAGGLFGSSASSGNAAPKGAPKRVAAPKAKGRGQQNPLIHAATMRAKTAKSFIEVEKNLEKALRSADTLLDVTAPKLLGADACSDTTLSLVHSRRALVLAAMDGACSGPGPETTATNQELFNMCLQDPYLRDCRHTLLDETSCQTLGAIKYSRNVTLDLQLVNRLICFVFNFHYV